MHDVLFVGNPIYESSDRRDAKLHVLKRVPNVLKVYAAVLCQSEYANAGVREGGRGRDC